MTGNFIQRSSTYNPLANVQHPIEAPRIIPPPISKPVEALTLEDLKRQEAILNDCLINLTKDLQDYSFHIIVNPLIDQLKDKDIIELADEIEELKIEPLDIKKNFEKAAHAIHQQAFVAFRKQSAEGKCEARFAPKWADLIGKGKIKQLTVIGEEGESERTIDVKDIEVTRFTAEEVSHFSRIILNAIGVAFELRTLEQQRKEIERQRKKDQEEMEQKEKRFREETLVERFNEWVRTLNAKRENSQRKKVCFSCNESESLISQIIAKQTEELKRQEELKKETEKKARIIKEEVLDFELKKRIIEDDNRSRDIKLSEIE